MKEISSFQTGQLVALATDVSPWILVIELVILTCFLTFVSIISF